MPRSRGACLAAVACAAALAVTGCSTSTPAPRLRLVWSDEFDGPAGAPPDAASWTPEAFGGEQSGNHELQCYTDRPENLATDGNGNLVITALRDGSGSPCGDGSTNAFTSARITTQGKHQWTYGRLEVRARVPAGVGTWPAFWAMGADKPEVGWPVCGEIDVMEHVGREPRTTTGTIHGPTAAGDHWYLHTETTTDADLSDGFHVYAVEWDGDGMTWSLDGTAFSHLTKQQAEQQGRWVFDRPFFLLLNLAVGGTLGGPVPEGTTFPQRLLVDYVRVYQEAPAGE